MTWETSAYKEHFAKVSESFRKETADYMVFMEQRHKIATLDYIATLEHANKMAQSRIDHLQKILKDNGIGE